MDKNVRDVLKKKKKGLVCGLIFLVCDYKKHLHYPVDFQFSKKEMHACCQSHNQVGGGTLSYPEKPHSKLHSQNESVSLCGAIQNTNNRKTLTGVLWIRREATTRMELPRGQILTSPPSHSRQTFPSVTVGPTKEKVGNITGQA